MSLGILVYSLTPVSHLHDVDYTNISHLNCLWVSVCFLLWKLNPTHCSLIYGGINQCAPHYCGTNKVLQFWKTTVLLMLVTLTIHHDYTLCNSLFNQWSFTENNLIFKHVLVLEQVEFTEEFKVGFTQYLF